MRFVSYALFAVLFAMSAGCGGASDAPTTYPVTGTVTLDGQPLAEGSIVMDPADGTGKPTAGGIVEGKYELEATPGAKIVRISAVKETGEKGQYGESVSESIIPEKYNADSELTAEVSASGENSFNFELKKE